MTETKPLKLPAQRLRELIADKSKIVNCPGVYDGLTARLALKERFDCLYMVSLAVGSDADGPFLTLVSRLVLGRQHPSWACRTSVWRRLMTCWKMLL